MFLVPLFREHEINSAHINLMPNGCNSSSDELKELLNLTKLDLEKDFDLLLLILFDNRIGNNIVRYKDTKVQRNILCGKAIINLDLQSVLALRK